MSRGISGSMQVITFANASNRGRVSLFSLNVSRRQLYRPFIVMRYDKACFSVARCEDICRRLYTSKKATMIASIHNFPLHCLLTVQTLPAENVLLRQQNGKSQAGTVSPSCPFEKPIRTQHSLRLPRL